MASSDLLGACAEALTSIAVLHAAYWRCDRHGASVESQGTALLPPDDPRFVSTVEALSDSLQASRTSEAQWREDIADAILLSLLQSLVLVDGVKVVKIGSLTGCTFAVIAVNAVGESLRAIRL